MQATSPPPPSDPVQAAIQRARSFKGKRNADWQPFVTTFPDLPIPDMPFCLVPVGSFMMGSDDGPGDEKPAHPQTIEQPYWIAQYPVTNAQWAAAVRAGVVKEPDDMGDSLKWYRDPKMADASVVGIDWFMARDVAA
jgi:formylglycine-generating enzyme required for sulfatase activity